MTNHVVFSKMFPAFFNVIFTKLASYMGHDYLPAPQCLSKATFFTNLEAVPFMSTLSMLSLDFEVFSVRFWSSLTIQIYGIFAYIYHKHQPNLWWM